MKKIITKQSKEIFADEIINPKNLHIGIRTKHFKNKGMVFPEKYIGNLSNLKNVKVKWIMYCVENFSSGNSWDMFNNLSEMTFEGLIYFLNEKDFEVYLFESFQEFSDWANKND